MPSGTEYVEIKATVANGNSRAIPSGDTETLGYYFSWDRTSGFSGSGWHTEVEDSPLHGYGYTDESFQDIMNGTNAPSNLDSYFKAWEHKLNQMEYNQAGSSIAVVNSFVNAILGHPNDGACILKETS